MSSGTFSADPSALQHSAAEVEQSAAALAALDVSSPFAEVSDALVGSATSQACLWVSTRLAAALQVYAEGLGSLAAAARVAATDFTGTDVCVASDYGVGR